MKKSVVNFQAREETLRLVRHNGDNVQMDNGLNYTFSEFVNGTVVGDTFLVVFNIDSPFYGGEIVCCKKIEVI